MSKLLHILLNKNISYIDFENVDLRRFALNYKFYLDEFKDIGFRIHRFKTSCWDNIGMINEIECARGGLIKCFVWV